jgi:hypothetical protein
MKLLQTRSLEELRGKRYVSVTTALIYREMLCNGLNSNGEILRVNLSYEDGVKENPHMPKATMREPRS